MERKTFSLVNTTRLSFSSLLLAGRCQISRISTKRQRVRVIEGIAPPDHQEDWVGAGTNIFEDSFEHRASSSKPDFLPELWPKMPSSGQKGILALEMRPVCTPLGSIRRMDNLLPIQEDCLPLYDAV
jgi:hypothetical protein